jgi:hypothetical protein
VGAGLAADNLMNSLYFAVLFGIARSAENPKEDDPAWVAAQAEKKEKENPGACDDGSDDVILQAVGRCTLNSVDP